MSFMFRKSKKVGPLRLTASKRGVSVSSGVPGLRGSVNTRGDKRASAGIPGSGLRWTKSKTRKR